MAQFVKKTGVYDTVFLLAFLAVRNISQDFPNQIMQGQAKAVLQARQNDLPTLLDEADNMKYSPSFLGSKIDWPALMESASDEKLPKSKWKRKRETLASWVKDRRAMAICFIADVLLFSQSNLGIELPGLQANDPRYEAAIARNYIEYVFFGFSFWLYAL